MKLMVQIPCYNEEENIKDVLKSIPAAIDNIDEITVVLLDDGSTDNTIKNALEFAPDIKIVKSKHSGLAEIFRMGLDYAIKNDADILVNLDGDNQYKGSDIKKLIKPILDKTADIIIGSRPIDKIKTFSFVKKFLLKLGSLIVRIISSIKIKDAASGFRAYNRKAILKTNIFNDYTYTIENIIQAKTKNLIIENVDIDTNIQKNRKSKLIKNNFCYIFKQTINLFRFFVIYTPVKFFGSISIFLFLAGVILGVRFLYYFFDNSGSGHVQSLILCSIILVLSFITANIAVISDILVINRKISEDIQEKLRQNKKFL